MASPGRRSVLAATRRLNVGSGSVQHRFAGMVNGGGILVKLGTASLTLSNPTGNNYGGGTMVSRGKLNITNSSGSGTGSGFVSVAPRACWRAGHMNAAGQCYQPRRRRGADIWQRADDLDGEHATTAASGVALNNGTNLNFNFGSGAERTLPT